MPEDKLSPGDRFHVRAATWNNLIDASDNYQLRKRLGAGGGAARSPISHTSVKVQADADLRFGEVAEISDTQLLDDLTAEHLWFNAAEPLASGRTYGITRRPIPAGSIDELQLTGVVRAYVNVTDEDHRFARVEAGERVLQSAIGGTVRIAWKPTGTGEQLCAVLLGAAEPAMWIRFLLSESLATSDAEADATINIASWTATAPTGAIVVKNLETHTASTYVFEGDSGDAGWAEYRSVDDTWHIWQMECP